MDNLKEFDSAKNKNNKGVLYVLIVIISLLLAALVVQYYYYNKTVDEVEQVSQEKAKLTVEYQSLLENYETLETSNDTLSTQLNAEKQKIEDLVRKLKSTKASNKAQIRKYKKELKTLRDIMKGFVRQIDSLNTLNVQLTEENQHIKKQYNSATKKNKQLSAKYEEASSKVQLASTIRAIDLNLEAYNKKGKLTTRARKTKRFGIKFKLDENLIAPTGAKQVYIRITDPEEHVLLENEELTFSFEGEDIVYSAVRTIDYNGEVTPATVYFESKKEELLSGEYKVDIFCDGKMIGETAVRLK